MTENSRQGIYKLVMVSSRQGTCKLVMESTLACGRLEMENNMGTSCRWMECKGEMGGMASCIGKKGGRQEPCMKVKACSCSNHQQKQQPPLTREGNWQPKSC